MSERQSVLQGMKIGFMGKGGAGKSTCLALFAQAMRARGYDVCVLDTDSTNEGLHLALGIDRPPRSLIDLFGGMVFLGGRVTCPADDPTVLEDADVALEQLPAESFAESESGIVFLAAGKLADFGVGAGCDGPMVKIARDLVVRRNGRPMTMLVDLKAGIEDTSRGVIIGMDDVIVVCDPSTAGLGVARSMTRLVDDLNRGAAPATSHIESDELADLCRQLFRDARLRRVETVLNKVPDDETETYMRQVLADAGIDPLAALRETAGIRQAWLRGQPLPHDGLTPAVNEALDRLESCAEADGALTT